MKTTDEKIHDFCVSVKKGFGTIADSSVKREYERINEETVESITLGKLLAVLEKNMLLDKKLSVNKEAKFYQHMFKTMKK